MDGKCSLLSGADYGAGLCSEWQILVQSGIGEVRCAVGLWVLLLRTWGVVGLGYSQSGGLVLVFLACLLFPKWVSPACQSSCICWVFIAHGCFFSAPPVSQSSGSQSCSRWHQHRGNGPQQGCSQGRQALQGQSSWPGGAGPSERTCTARASRTRARTSG